MRRSDPYNDTNWDENGVLNSSSFEEFREDDDQPSPSKRNSLRSIFTWFKGPWRRQGGNDSNEALLSEEEGKIQKPRSSLINVNKLLVILIIIASITTVITRLSKNRDISSNGLLALIKSFHGGQDERPAFVFEHPYISSSYYTSTKSISTLKKVDKFQVQPKKEQLAGKKAEGEKDFTRETKTRLAILRPFCAFDAGPLPTTFDCWQNFPPCRASAYELGEELDPSWYDKDRYFDDVGSHMQRNAKAGEFVQS